MLVLLVLMYAAFLFNWQITLIILVTVPMQAYIMYVEFPIIGKASELKIERTKAFLSRAQEAFEKALAARLIHICAFMRERVTGSGGDLRKATGALKQIRMKIDYRTGLVDTFGVMAVVVVGAIFLRSGRLASLGQVLALYRIAQKINTMTGMGGVKKLTTVVYTVVWRKSVV